MVKLASFILHLLHSHILQHISGAPRALNDHSWDWKLNNKADEEAKIQHTSPFIPFSGFNGQLEYHAQFDKFINIQRKILVIFQSEPGSFHYSPPSKS